MNSSARKVLENAAAMSAKGYNRVDMMIAISRQESEAIAALEDAGVEVEWHHAFELEYRDSPDGDLRWADDTGRLVYKTWAPAWVEPILRTFNKRHNIARELRKALKDPERRLAVETVFRIAGPEAVRRMNWTEHQLKIRRRDYG